MANAGRYTIILSAHCTVSTKKLHNIKVTKKSTESKSQGGTRFGVLCAFKKYPKQKKLEKLREKQRNLTRGRRSKRNKQINLMMVPNRKMTKRKLRHAKETQNRLT